MLCGGDDKPIRAAWGHDAGLTQIQHSHCPVLPSLAVLGNAPDAFAHTDEAARSILRLAKTVQEGEPNFEQGASREICPAPMAPETLEPLG